MKYRLLAQYLYYGILSLLVIYALYKIDWIKLSSVKYNYYYIVIASCISLCTRFLYPSAWKIIIETMNTQIHVDYFSLNKIYSQAWLGRYIPGKVVWLGGKILFASKLGISKTMLTVSTVFETGMQLILSIFLGLMLLVVSGNTNQIDINVLLFSACSLGLLMLIFSPQVFNKLITLALRIFKRDQNIDENYPLLSIRTILSSALLYSLILTLGIFVYILLFLSVGAEFTTGSATYIGGVILFTGGIGMLAFFAPSGLGVRDGFQIILLSIIFPLELSILVVLLGRLISIVNDILYFSISRTKLLRTLTQGV